MSEPPRSRYFRLPFSEERRERNWNAIAAKLPARRRREPLAFRVLVLACMVAILIALVTTRYVAPPTGAIDGAVLETGAGEQQSLELGDGSHIVLEPSTRLQLERVSGREIRLRVTAGAVTANVTHVAGRPFTVVAGPVAVHVVGTKFRVESDGEHGRVLVAVSEGRVTLSRSDGQPAPRSLGAGETWTSNPMQAPVESPSPDAGRMTDGTDGSAPVARPPVVSRRFRDLWREGRFGAAWATIARSDLDALIATAGPEDVFAIAESARMSGHAREAARAFDAFRRRFRSDARAPLAALELGRLRLSELGAPTEAQEAFEDAITLDPAGTFREDSEARLVEALEAAGLSAECAAARERYLAKYPGGLHERMVKRRCR